MASRKTHTHEMQPSHTSSLLRDHLRQRRLSSTAQDSMDAQREREREREREEREKKKRERERDRERKRERGAERDIL